MLLGFQESQFSLGPQLATPALTPNVSESVSGQAMSQMHISLHIFHNLAFCNRTKYLNGSQVDKGGGGGVGHPPLVAEISTPLWS